MSSKRLTRPWQSGGAGFGLQMVPKFLPAFLACLVACCSFFGFAASGQEAAEEESQLVSAETPTLLAEKLAVDGVYIAPGRNDITADVLIAAVDRAGKNKVSLVALAPDDPQPDPAAFARRVQEKLGVDAAIVFPPNGGLVEAYAAQDYDSNRTRAANRAQDETDPGRAIDVYVEELQDDGSRSVPVFILVFIAVVLGLLYLAYWSGVREEKERQRLRAELTESPAVKV